MRSLDAYLMFNGNCREAMTAYAEALGAPVEFTDAAEGQCAPQDVGRVMHARIQKGNLRLMASDTMSQGTGTFTVGTNVRLSLDCESAGEQDAAFTKLATGGAVKMELQDTFWGARFGMLTDRFGIEWLFNFDKTA